MPIVTIYDNVYILREFTGFEHINQSLYVKLTLHISSLVTLPPVVKLLALSSDLVVLIVTLVTGIPNSYATTCATCALDDKIIRTIIITTL